MENEKRLIDANTLRTQFDDIPPFIGMTGGRVQQYIDKAPTVDAVEVVRCKDCKWRNTRACPYMLFNAVARTDKDYCSDGERTES